MNSPLRAALRDRLKVAMRARDRETMEATRVVLAALENAEAVPQAPTETKAAQSEHVAGAAVGPAAEAPRRDMSRDDERAWADREIAKLRSSAETLASAGLVERAANGEASPRSSRKSPMPDAPDLASPFSLPVKEANRLRPGTVPSGRG